LFLAGTYTRDDGTHCCCFLFVVGGWFGVVVVGGVELLSC
jgi:hypothetical protein